MLLTPPKSEQRTAELKGKMGFNIIVTKWVDNKNRSVRYPIVQGSGRTLK